MGACAKVSLRYPPPLDIPLAVEDSGRGGLILHYLGRLIAEATPASRLSIAVPAPPDRAAARRAALAYPGFIDHPFASCFACGPERAEGDGLRIFPGPLDGTDLVAAPWTPPPGLASSGGLVADEFVWAALDCPGGWAASLQRQPGSVAVLGTLQVDIVHPIEVGRAYIATAWAVGNEGRKTFAASALHSEEGAVCALAMATWVELASSASPTN